MFGTLGGPEIFLILAIALIVFGPRKLPEIGKSMGRMLAEFRKASTEFQRTVEMEVEAEKRAPAPLPPAPATAPPATAPPGTGPPGTAPPAGETTDGTPRPAPAEGSVAQGSQPTESQPEP